MRLNLSYTENEGKRTWIAQYITRHSQCSGSLELCAQEAEDSVLTCSYSCHRGLPTKRWSSWRSLRLYSCNWLLHTCAESPTFTKQRVLFEMNSNSEGHLLLLKTKITAKQSVYSQFNNEKTISFWLLPYMKRDSDCLFAFSWCIYNMYLKDSLISVFCNG